MTSSLTSAKGKDVLDSKGLGPLVKSRDVNTI
jgi:hypothetical protein